MGLALGSDDDSVDEVLKDDANGAHGVVVSGNGVFQLGRIAIGIDDADDGDLEALGFGYGDGLASGVDDDDSVRVLLHVAHSVEVAVEFVLFPVESSELFLGHGLILRSTLDVLEILEALHRVADGGEIGKGATEPTVVDVVLSGCFGSFANGFLRLTLAADEEDFFVFTSESGKEVGCFIEALDGFFEVDDVNAAFILHEVRLHFWIPLLGLVSVVDASLDHIFDEFVNHCFLVLR